MINRRLTDKDHPFARLVANQLLHRPQWIRDWLLANGWHETTTDMESWCFHKIQFNSKEPDPPTIRVMIVAANDDVLMQNRVESLLRIAVVNSADLADLVRDIVEMQPAIDRLAATLEATSTADNKKLLFNVCRKTAGPAWRSLRKAGVATIGDVIEHTRSEILATSGFGKVSIAVLDATLERFELDYRRERRSAKRA